MNTAVTVPTVYQFRKAGYKVRVNHCRQLKVAYINPRSNKLVVKNVMVTDEADGAAMESDQILGEVLPKGGETRVTVFDSESQLEFVGVARCHEVDNYNKKVGVQKALEQVIGLMQVTEGKDGFKMRV